MRKTTIGSVLAILSMVCLCLCLVLSPVTNEASTFEAEQVYTAPITVAPADEDVETVKAVEPELEETSAKPELDSEQLEAHFTKMLDLNYCYGASFDNPEMMAACSAISLMDYAADVHGYGIGVNQNLVKSFVKSFYGVELDEQPLSFDESPEGYVMTPALEVGTQTHTVLSITETEQGYEVMSTVMMYYGGDDCDICLVKSVFSVADGSEFGFNLISCELV